MAAARTLQPWAGTDSLCAECGAPLARVAGGAPYPPAPAAAPPPPAAPAAPDRSWQPPPPAPVDSFASSDTDTDPTRGGNGALVLGIVVLGLLVGGFLLVRALGGPADGTPGPGRSDGAAASAEAAGGGEGAADRLPVTQVSPPELRRVLVPVDALVAPRAGAAVAGRLGAEAAVDVTGRVTAEGDRWARVVLPGAGGRTGFVREAVLQTLGDPVTLEAGPAAASPVPPAAGSGLAGAGAAPGTAGLADGPREAMTPTLVYIASRRANVRSAASAASARIGQGVFGDTLMVIARQSMAGRLWYEVQLPDGRTGWINAGLVSQSRPQTPIDAQPAPAPPGVDPAPGAASDRVRPAGLAPDRVAEADQGRPQAVPPREPADGLFARGMAVSVQTPQANIRAEPSTRGEVIDRVGFADRLKVEQTTQADGRIWLRVTTAQGITGWISSSTVAPD